MMLQQPAPDDFVIGTGKSHSVREFVTAAFAVVGIPKWDQYIEIDPRYYRPAEVENLVADARKAKEKLDWAPKVTFEALVARMMKYDLLAYGLRDKAEAIVL